MTDSNSLGTLEDVLKYRDDRLLQKFRTLFDVSVDESQDLFIEMKKWLWICMKRKADRRSGVIPKNAPPLAVYSGMVVIDELWHTFILHTQEYQEFCIRYCGELIHHSPGYPDFNLPTDQEMTEQVEYIWENLGEDTVDLWYTTFPVTYSAEKLQSLVKPRIFGSIRNLH